MRFPKKALAGLKAPCERCGRKLPEHAWAELDKDGFVMDCPNPLAPLPKWIERLRG